MSDQRREESVRQQSYAQFLARIIGRDLGLIPSTGRKLKISKKRKGKSRPALEAENRSATLN
jgi:hypothetical protein